MVMADVSGKGVPAALFMMVSKIILQSCAMLGKTPGEILTKTNEAICSNNDENMFVTVWVGVLELSTGKLTASNAGHEYPVIKEPGQPFRILKDKHSFVLGAIGGKVYEEYEMQFEPGTRIFLYTDGIPEALGGEDSGEMFGTGRMLEALNRTASDASAHEILMEVYKSLEVFVSDAAQFDDLTMLCLEYKGLN